VDALICFLNSLVTELELYLETKLAELALEELEYQQSIAFLDEIHQFEEYRL
jgi:predicted AAA+ superfamily ATPase